MVKLVTSRVHRCYSTTGGVRSARNERMNDIMHVLGSTLLLASGVLSLPKVSPASLADRQTMAAFGTGLLTLVQLGDMFAITMAHRMFYQSPRQTNKRKPFFETPTKVDGVVSVLCLVASLAAFFAVRFPGASNPVKDAMFGHQLSVCAFSTFALAMFINSVIGSPGQAARLPLALSAAHNVAVCLFLCASAANALLSLFALSMVTNDVLRIPLALGTTVAYAMIWAGSVVNFFRVKALLETPRKSLGDSMMSISKRSTGILAWFQPAKSQSNNLSDFDSDEFDEEEGYSSDGDSKWRR